jgi:murein DD-endopeptidase MepM/ murein hydrolase activator NlpD
MRRPPRAARSAAIPILTLLMMLMTALAPPSAHAVPCWRPPVVGQVIDRFRAPACPYCAGNRGIEFGTGGMGATVPVQAVEAGVVTFSGSVAGTFYVVIEHSNQWKVTYGRLSAVQIEKGQRVARGGRLGTANGDLYFGLRVGGTYRDPEPFLGQHVGRRRLVPVDGTSRRSVPAPTWVCGP